MKRIMFFFVLCVIQLGFPFCLEAQNKSKLEGVIWHRQDNYKSGDIYSDIMMLENGVYNEALVDVTNGKILGTFEGAYEIKSGKLGTQIKDGSPMLYSVKWISKETIILTSQYGDKFRYAIYKSKEDKHYYQVIVPFLKQDESEKSETQTAIPFIPQQYNQPSTCNFCHGIGECTACFGRGDIETVNYTTGGTTRTTCTICGGTKKCNHCNGSGRQ